MWYREYGLSITSKSYRSWRTVLAVCAVAVSLNSCGDLFLEAATDGPADFEVTIPDRINANRGFLVTVTAVDDEGNRITTYDDTVTLTADWGDLRPISATPEPDGTQSYPESDGVRVDLDGGKATVEVYLNRRGPLTVAVTDGATTASSKTVTVDPEEWENHQVVLQLGTAPGGSDSSGCRDPSVLKIGGTYHMWYAGEDSSAVLQINYCSSDDGITWTTPVTSLVRGDGGSTEDAQNIRAPSVMYENGEYIMWYEGDDGTNREILRRTSSDGIDWSSPGSAPVIRTGNVPPYDSNNAVGGCIVKSGDTYHFYYSGSDGTDLRIATATSDDGINWSNFSLSVDKGLEGYADAGRVYYPSVIRDGSIFRMWYTGGVTASYWSVLETYSTSDGTWATGYRLPLSWNVVPYDNDGTYSPYVFRDGDRLRMWYAARGSGANFQIFHCEASL